MNLERRALGELRRAGLHYRRSDRWQPVPPELDDRIERDYALAAVARAARASLCREAARHVGVGGPLLDAVLRVRRERFVLPDDIGESACDVPLPLDRNHDASVSAPHSYLLCYQILGLSPGESLLELGSGTGYGAALAADVVGPGGWVDTIEIDRPLCERARRLLGAVGTNGAAGGEVGPPIRVWSGDGRALASMLLRRGSPARKVSITYALPELPQDLLRGLPEGGVLVAPVGPPRGQQTLVRVARRNGRLVTDACAAVRYVPERHAA